MQVTWLTNAVVMIALFVDCVCACVCVRARARNWTGRLKIAKLAVKCVNWDMVISVGATGGRAVRETDFMCTR